MHVAQAPGGVSVYIESLVKELNRGEFESILVCSQDYNQQQMAPYFDVIEQVWMERSIRISKIFKPVLATRRIIKKYKPDIVYCHSSIAGVVGRVAAIGCGTKALYNAHGWSFNMRVSPFFKFVFRLVEKSLALFTDKIVCVSNFEKKTAISGGICSPNKIEVVYNGVDVAGLQEKIAASKVTRESLGIPHEAYVVGMVGRISKQKAPDVFVKIAKKIKESIPNAFFVIVGGGPDQELIEKQIRSFELSDAFLITGWVSNPHDYMALFDQPVLLSRWEAFGLALVEYMASRKAVVCTNADAMPEIVKSEENGIVVNVDDCESAARAVVRLFNDEKLRENMSNRALEMAKQSFDLSYTVEKMSDLFKKMVEEE